MLKGFFSLVMTLFLLGSAWACPTVEKLQTIFKGLFVGGEVKVLGVNQTPIKGVCEVVIEIRGQKRLIYVDDTGRYLFIGRIIDILTREDLTQARQAELNRLSPEQLKKLDSLVAFVEGKGGPVVYLVTDPDCPHCRRAERILLPLVEEGKITVKVILMPLERLHPHAKKRAISIICDKKGLKELISGYEGSSCPEGEKKVTEARNLLLSMGIRATPTYIFSDGRFISGVLEAEKILSLARQK